MAASQAAGLQSLSRAGTAFATTTIVKSRQVRAAAPYGAQAECTRGARWPRGFNFAQREETIVKIDCRTMKPMSAGIVLAAALLMPTASVAGQNCCTPAKQAIQTTSRPASSVPFTASHAPGVVVRHIPSPATASGAQVGSIAILPGGTMPTVASTAMPPKAHTTAQSWVTPTGAIAAFAPPEAFSYARATVSPSGRAEVECVTGQALATARSVPRAPARTKAKAVASHGKAGRG